MEQTVMSLINAAANVETTTATSQALSASGAGGLFADLLSKAVNEGGKAAAASAAEADGAKAPFDLAELLAALVGKGGSDLAEALQSAAAGSSASVKDASRAVTETSDVRAGAGAASNGGEAAGTARGKSSDTVNGGSSAGADLQSILVGLISLVMKENAGGAEASGTTTGDAAGDEKTAADATAASQTADTAAAGDKSKQDGQSILQALGLLLFAGLEAAAAAQNGAAAVSGQAQAETQGGTQRETEQAQSSATSASLLVSQRRTGLAGKSASGAIEAGSAGPQPEETDVAAYAAAAAQKSPAQDERTAAPRMVTVSAALKEDDTAKNNITLTIKTAQNINGEASLTLVKELATTIDAGNGAGSDGNGTGKDKSGDREVYPLTPDNGSSATSVSAQEQTSPGTANVSGSIERFDKVLDQIAGRSGSHDVTVRLTLDNHESLVLGLKDLGQSITVDVKSSDQGMIGLLQSQKETIMQHLDSQDVRAQIVIDPNAYGTNDQKGRQEEARQKSFTSRRQPDATFGAFLETFA